MGLLIEGVWHDKGYDTAKTKGAFKRSASHFRNWITADGRPGVSGSGGFKIEPGRYHLYVSLACPWAHRTLIFRCLKGLETVLSVSIVHPHMLYQGWAFGRYPGATADSELGATAMHQVYTTAIPDYSGRVTVPVLWDKKRRTIVNNESAEIIRMLNTVFDPLATHHYDFYPEPLRQDIDEINDWVYASINNGVYRTGFATTQSAYQEAFDAVFSALDRLETLLETNRYLAGDRITEADWRLFTTLIRFDAVYFGHFKCNLRRIVDYPNLQGYLQELYQFKGIAETVNFEHIKQHYYFSHRHLNPIGIIPSGPILTLDEPHGRGHLPGKPLSECVFS